MGQTIPTPVRFVTHRDIMPADAPGAVGGYEAGDVVGLPADLAADLIAAGIAVANPIPGLTAATPGVPDPAAALAAAGAVIDGLGTRPANPAAPATLAALSPAFFANGKTA